MARNLILMLPLVLLTSNVALSQLLVWDRSIEDYLQSMKLGEALSDMDAPEIDESKLPEPKVVSKVVKIPVPTKVEVVSATQQSVFDRLGLCLDKHGHCRSASISRDYDTTRPGKPIRARRQRHHRHDHQRRRRFYRTMFGDKIYLPAIVPVRYVPIR